MKKYFNSDEYYKEIFSNENRLLSALNEMKDIKVDLGTRIDLAMALSVCDQAIVLDSLVEIAKDASQDNALLDACGESFGEIWARKGSLPNLDALGIVPVSASIAKATFIAIINNESNKNE